jgi:hypothetical protein
MEINEIIKLSELSVKDFSDLYKIPVETLENWTNSNTNDLNRCPEYLKYILESLVRYNLKYDDYIVKYCKKPSLILRENKDNIINVFKKYEKKGLKNLRVFGSAVRGDDTDSSDIDFLVHVDSKDPNYVIGAYMYLKIELKELLHINVDVVIDSNLYDGFKNEIKKDLISIYEI